MLKIRNDTRVNELVSSKNINTQIGVDNDFKSTIVRTYL